MVAIWDDNALASPDPLGCISRHSVDAASLPGLLQLEAGQETDREVCLTQWLTESARPAWLLAPFTSNVTATDGGITKFCRFGLLAASSAGRGTYTEIWYTLPGNPARGPSVAAMPLA